MLGRRWRAQGRECAYWPREGCQRIATEVDHVVPLVRGGTNREGNLTPACKHCNSSKGGLTVIEWRTGKRLPQMVKPVTHKRKPKPVKVKPLGKPVQTMLNICPECGGLCVNKYCDDTCNSRYVMRTGRCATDQGAAAWTAWTACACGVIVAFSGNKLPTGTPKK